MNQHNHVPMKKNNWKRNFIKFVINLTLPFVCFYLRDTARPFRFIKTLLRSQCKMTSVGFFLSINMKNDGETSSSD